MRTLLQEFAQGARALLRSRGFTALAILTLALGVGTNAAMFSVLDGIALRPLNYPEADRLVMVTAVEPTGEHPLLTRAQFAQCARRNRSLDGLAAFTLAGARLAGPDHARLVVEALATPGFFTLLGARPLSGRTLSRGEEESGAAAVAVLSYNFWRAELASDPAAIGKTLRVGDTTYSIVGVTGPRFKAPGYPRVDLWVPLTLDPSYKGIPQLDKLIVLGRLKRGVSLEQARAQMEGAFLEEGTSSGAPPQIRAELSPLKEYVVGTDYLNMLLKLYIGVCLALLIACADLVNLLLARASARRAEIAVRASLGASRWRIVRQLSAESLLLGVAGGALAIPLTYWLVDLFVAAAPTRALPRLDEVVVDWHVLVFAIAVGAVCSVGCGLLLARKSIDPARGESLGELLKGASGGALAEPPRAKLARRLLVFEVALSVVVGVAAGLVVRTYFNLRPADLGFDPSSKLTLRLYYPQGKYGTPTEKAALLGQLCQRVEAVSAVKAVAAAEPLPMGIGSGWATHARILGGPERSAEQSRLDLRFVSDNYFKVMRVRQLSGRPFTPNDNADSTPVAIVNPEVARRFWPGENSIGKCLMLPELDPKKVWQVVGVVGDERIEWSDTLARPQVYLSYSQHPVEALELVVQTERDPEKLASVVEKQVGSVDKDIAILRPESMAKLISSSVAPWRFYATLTCCFAVLASLLAAVGVYGVMWYGAVRRTREIGIRMALGAQRGHVLRLVLAQGLKVAVMGTGMGLLAALAAAPVMSSFLYDVKPRDPLTFAICGAVTLGLAAVASYLPARRATKVDPMVALRHE